MPLNDNGYRVLLKEIPHPVVILDDLHRLLWKNKAANTQLAEGDLRRFLLYVSTRGMSNIANADKTPEEFDVELPSSFFKMLYIPPNGNSAHDHVFVFKEPATSRFGPESDQDHPGAQSAYNYQILQSISSELQVITSLLHVEADAVGEHLPDLGVFERRTIYRLRLMSDAYRQAAGSGDVEVVELLREHCVSLVRHDPSKTFRYRTGDSTVRLPLHAAIQFCLTVGKIVSELGSLSSSASILEVDLSADKSEVESNVRLLRALGHSSNSSTAPSGLSESDAPTWAHEPTEQARRTVAGLAKALQGSEELRFEPNSVRWSIAVPGYI